MWCIPSLEAVDDMKGSVSHRYLGLSLIPSRSGIYSIGIELGEPIEVCIRRKPYRLEAGTYVYTGSALGRCNNLHSRISRHLSSRKKVHWHIDQISISKHASILFVVFSETLQRKECTVNNSIARITRAKSPVPGLGSSDCRSKCESHFLSLERDGAVTKIVKAYELSGLNARALEVKTEVSIEERGKSQVEALIPRHFS